MVGHLDGIYVKDGILVLNRQLAEAIQAEPVMGKAYEAVIKAQREQVAIDERHFQKTGDVDYAVHGHKERVKAAMQAALTEALAEPDGA